jgi:hypothetical protein
MDIASELLRVPTPTGPFYISLGPYSIGPYFVIAYICFTLYLSVWGVRESVRAWWRSLGFLIFAYIALSFVTFYSMNACASRDCMLTEWLIVGSLWHFLFLKVSIVIMSTIGIYRIMNRHRT